jgi:hypothetical protein
MGTEGRGTLDGEPGATESVPATELDVLAPGVDVEGLGSAVDDGTAPSDVPAGTKTPAATSADKATTAPTRTRTRFIASTSA